MPGSITLPQIVLDLEEEDRKQYEALRAPKTIVVRYGYMRFIAELPYDGTDKPGCGSKMVIRTERGTEIAEMLTTTCSNGGCGKSVSRQDMLSYIDNSGGKNYPFTTQGRILRVATPEDILEQRRLDSQKIQFVQLAKQKAGELHLPMKVVDVELLLGSERALFHYTSEQWIDFRELVKVLASHMQTRIEMHQVTARDEARIVADFERCGQHCCCKQFLKILKPVNMRMAKIQKATLDPAKISGRCGRLMCCLRYEDQTYEHLRKKLPHKQTRMLSADGPGTVLDTQILTQLVLLKLDHLEAPAAYPLETLQPLPRDKDPMFNRPPASSDGSSPSGSGGGWKGAPGNAAGRPSQDRRERIPEASRRDNIGPSGSSPAARPPRPVDSKNSRSGPNAGQNANAARPSDGNRNDSRSRDRQAGPARSGSNSSSQASSNPPVSSGSSTAPSAGADFPDADALEELNYSMSRDAAKSRHWESPAAPAAGASSSGNGMDESASDSDANDSSDQEADFSSDMEHSASSPNGPAEGTDAQGAGEGRRRRRRRRRRRGGNPGQGPQSQSNDPSRPQAGGNAGPNNTSGPNRNIPPASGPSNQSSGGDFSSSPDNRDG